MGCPHGGGSTLTPPPPHPRREIHSKSNHAVLGPPCATAAPDPMERGGPGWGSRWLCRGPCASAPPSARGHGRRRGAPPRPAAAPALPAAPAGGSAGRGCSSAPPPGWRGTAGGSRSAPPPEAAPQQGAGTPPQHPLPLQHPPCERGSGCSIPAEGWGTPRGAGVGGLQPGTPPLGLTVLLFSWRCCIAHRSFCSSAGLSSSRRLAKVRHSSAYSWPGDPRAPQHHPRAP